MNSSSEAECQPSLPNHVLPALPSSPPVLIPSSGLGDMDNGPGSEPEPSQKQDAPGSRPLHRRVDSDETERPTSAQQTQHDADDHTSEDSEGESEDDDSDPAHRIDGFDWEDLHRRYHEAMKACHGEEAALMEEWESLMTVIFAAPKYKQEMIMTFHLVFPHMGAIRA
jgi:hypothetical protein